MKKLSLYVILVLMFCNVGVAKDLTGTKLLCLLKTDDIENEIGIKFIDDRNVSIIHIKDWKVVNDERFYWTDPEAIYLGGPSGTSIVYRKNLVMIFIAKEDDYQCEIIKKEFNLTDRIKKLLNHRIKENKEKNIL